MKLSKLIYLRFVLIFISGDWMQLTLLGKNSIFLALIGCFFIDILTSAKKQIDFYHIFKKIYWIEWNYRCLHLKGMFVCACHFFESGDLWQPRDEEEGGHAGTKTDWKHPQLPWEWGSGVKGCVCEEGVNSSLRYAVASVCATCRQTKSKQPLCSGMRAATSSASGLPDSGRRGEGNSLSEIANHISN